MVCGVEIGKYAFVGAGAVVTRPVGDYAVVTGAPARQTGWMCRCGGKLSFGQDCMAVCGDCLRKYMKTDGGVYENE